MMEGLEKSASVFMKGLPRNQDLQNSNIAHIFFDVLREGLIVKPRIGEDEPALLECFHNGWLHADNLKLGGRRCGETTAYIFPSPLHRWFVEKKLCDSIHATRPGSDSLLQLVIAVIKGFTPRFLRKRRIGPGCIQSQPDAQYQDEFYRSCHALWKGSLTTFPESGTKNGRVDFYIPSKQWGVELLHEGDRLKQHSCRFSGSGAYGNDLMLSDFIILDCRTSQPRRSHDRMCIYYLSTNSFFVSR